MQFKHGARSLVYDHGLGDLLLLQPKPSVEQVGFSMQSWAEFMLKSLSVEHKIKLFGFNPNPGEHLSHYSSVGDSGSASGNTPPLGASMVSSPSSEM